MTNLKRLFVLAAALSLALGPIGDGTASAQDGEVVGIEISHTRPPGHIGVYSPITRFKIDRVIGSARGVTVELAADTIRLGPGKYWFFNRQAVSGGAHAFTVREIPAVSGTDSTGTTVAIMGGGRPAGEPWQSKPTYEFFVVVDGEGATSDDVKLGTVGRRVDFTVEGGRLGGDHTGYLFIRRLSD